MLTLMASATVPCAWRRRRTRIRKGEDGATHHGGRVPFQCCSPRGILARAVPGAPDSSSIPHRVETGHRPYSGELVRIL